MQQRPGVVSGKFFITREISAGSALQSPKALFCFYTYPYLIANVIVQLFWFVHASPYAGDFG